MSKEDNYEVTAREDVTADIPVANVPEGAENALLPKKESEDDDLIVKFRKPFDFEGEIYEKLDLHALEGNWFTGRILRRSSGLRDRKDQKCRDRFFLQRRIRHDSGQDIQKTSVYLAMATHTGIDFFTDLPIDEFIDVAKEVNDIGKQNKV